LLVVAPPSLPAQQVEGATPTPLTLRDAVDEALAGNPAHRVSGRRASIARADARAAGSGLLPALEVGTGVTRSDDPVFAFGTRLRQERFTEADFALDALNRPGAITDWTMDAGLRWAPLDATRWAGRSAARSLVDAADWGETWSAEQTVFATKVLYYGAAGAHAALAAAEAEEAAARAALELFERREGRGLLTRADVLQAEAELRAAEAYRLVAARNVERAREDLALHLGWEIDRIPVPTDALIAPSPPAGTRPTETRADVRALAAAREAASAEFRRAGLSFLPRIEGFAGWSSHADRVFGADGSNWTAGVALRWTVFAGFGRVADRRRATEAREIARIRHEEAVRTARAEAAQALRDVHASRAGFEATRAAARAAGEARELMRRRFDEGLATAAEFLQAEARAAGARSREVAALVDYNVALARLELVATGADDRRSQQETR
jgi:outer membrane protein TolC